MRFWHEQWVIRLLAAAVLLSAGQLQADDAADIYNQGVALLTATNIPGARALFEQVIRNNPESDSAAPAHCRLAQLLIATDPRAAAAQYAAAAVTTNAAVAAVAAFGWGEALYQAADWKGAREAYADYLARFPNGLYQAQALYSKGWTLLQTGDFSGALAEFQAFQQKFPEHPLFAESRLKTADCLRQLQRNEEALQVYEQVRAAGGKYVPDALSGRARVLLACRDFAAAQAAFLEAAQAYGRDAHAANCLFDAGSAALEVRQYATAAELFGRVQQAWPAHERARPSMYWQALALFRQGQMAAAADRLGKLREAGVPQELSVECTMLLAQVQENRHFDAEAAALYRFVSTNYPEHVLAESAAVSSIVAFEKSGDLRTAEAAASAFVWRYPASEQRPAILFLVGEYRYRLASYAEAAPALEEFARVYVKHELAAAALHKAGWCYWNLKQAARARERFASVVANYAQSPLAVESAFMLGRVAEASGDAAAAMEGYEEAARLGKESDTALRAILEQMRMDQAARRYDVVLNRVETFLIAHTNSVLRPRVLLYRGEALLEMGRLPEAQQAYQLVGDSDPAAAAGAAYGMAWVLRRQARHAEAAEAFDKLAFGSSTYVDDAIFWAARSYEDAGRFDTASATYGRCLQRVSPGTHADEAAYRQAYCLWQTHKPDDAVRLYSTMIQERSASPFAANALYDLAWVMLEREKKPEARQRFEEFVGLFPKHLLAPDAHFRIGELAYEKEDFAAAAQHYELAAAAQVEFRDKALYKLGWTLEKQGHCEAAVQTFLRLAHQLPSSEYVPESQFRAGVLLQGLHRLNEARAALASVTDGPFAEKAAFTLAECWRAADKHAEAAAAYGQVLTKWPHGDCRLQALLARASELQVAGAVTDAIAEYAEVIRAGETREAAQAMLGQGHCWFALGKWEDAARCFAKVDVLYEFNEYKPEALAMAARSWERAGDAAKAAMYREDLKRRFPRYRDTQAVSP